MDVIHDVTRRGDVESLRRMLAANPSFPLAEPKFTCFLQTPLHVAVKLGYVEFASEIVRFDPLLASEKDSQGFTPLHFATSKYNDEMVKILINANPDACLVPDQDGRTPLHLAAIRNDVLVMDLLMQSRPQAIHQVLPDTEETILHLCVKHNNFRGMEKLVDYLATNKANGADNYPDKITVNSIDSDGNTILHLAAQMDRKKMLRYLLNNSEIGVDASIRNTNKLRVLDMLDEDQKYTLGFGYYHDTTIEARKQSSTSYHDTTIEARQQSSTSTTDEWLKERLNSIMIVAALIAAVAFQAVINPPGGVFQEDSKVDSVTDPVLFTYYLKTVVGNRAMSEGFQWYHSHIDKLPAQTTGRGNITVDDEIITYRANFVKDLLTAANDRESLTKSPLVSKKLGPGIVLEDDWWMNITSKYNSTMRGGSSFSPYLIRYAGTAILAYTSPKTYGSYIFLNSLSLVVCALMILIVTFDAVNQLPSRSPASLIKYLEVLVAIAVACVSLSYMIVVRTVVPPFYVDRTLLVKLLSIFGGIICLPLFISKLYFITVNHPYMERRFGKLRQYALDDPSLRVFTHWFIFKIYLIYFAGIGLGFGFS
ncbi:hypothetical protein MKW92_008548 [Papaver armeniacum]|nr:hypothetical protein MKW92_008548 [Papaver armeniacum]